MHLVDTNIILRYVLKDHPEMYAKAKEFLEVQEITIPLEIVAEVVYVLEKVYHTERTDIRQTLLTLTEYDNLRFLERDILLPALALYSDNRVDFIDAVLAAYQKARHATIHTFDQALQKLLRQSLLSEKEQHDTGKADQEH